MAEFAHWQEWGERCAADLCSDAAKKALHDFAQTRWRSYMTKKFGPSSPELDEMSARDCCHKFEMQCLVGSGDTAKRYKSSLFKRLALKNQADPADAIERGAYAIIRSAVKHFIRHEGRMRLPLEKKHRKKGKSEKRKIPEIERSLQDEAPGSDGLTYGDLLPDSVSLGSELEEREFRRLAHEEATVLLSKLTRRQRIVLAARALGIAISNPLVEELAGSKKSVLSDELKKIEITLVNQIYAKFHDEDAVSRECLSRQALQELASLAVQMDNSSEIWLPRLFETIDPNR